VPRSLGRLMPQNVDELQGSGGHPPPAWVPSRNTNATPTRLGPRGTFHRSTHDYGKRGQGDSLRAEIRSAACNAMPAPL